MVARIRGKRVRVITPSTTAEPLIKEPALGLIPEPAGEPANFSWAKHWYAVCAARDVDPSRPLPLTLLGKNLVIWKNSSTGQWSCLEDRCPHRAAPLSEGKIWPDGNLCCSYHGWRFDGSGACKAIPQADSAEQEARAAAAPRACAVAYPIQERQGLLFVWGEGGAAALEEAMKQEPPLCTLTEEAEALGKEVTEVMGYFTSDVPYDYAALAENVLDPSHVPWAHHGVQGDRTKMKFGISGVRETGELSAEVEPIQPTLKSTVINFHPPGLARYVSELKQGGRAEMLFYMTPLAPGRSRVIAHVAISPSLPTPVKLLLSLRPAWWEHIMVLNATLDGDGVFLGGQDRILARHAQQEGATWRDLYYMPTSADTLVAALRQWLDDKAGGGPFGSLRDGHSPAALAASAALLAPPSRREALDRYNQHTVHCAACRSALRTVTALRNILVGAAVLTWAAWLSPLLLAASAWLGSGAAAAVASSQQPLLRLPLVLGAIALTAAAALLTNVRSRFIFVDYVHAHR
ncbi:hypothetical protein N2152v2_010622 [Parachlorella kessleri]